jgi:hypothetical protein
VFTLEEAMTVRMEGRSMISLSLTSGQKGAGGQRHALAALPPGKKPDYQLYLRLAGPQGRSGRVWKISPSAGIPFPDRPIRHESCNKRMKRSIGITGKTCMAGDFHTCKNLVLRM